MRAGTCPSASDGAYPEQSPPPPLSRVPRIAAAPGSLPGDWGVMSVYGPPRQAAARGARSQLPARQGWEPSVIMLTSTRVMITMNEIIRQAAFPSPRCLLCPSWSLSWGKGSGSLGARHGAEPSASLSHCIFPSPQVRYRHPPLQMGKLRLSESGLGSPYACLSPAHTCSHCSLALSANAHSGGSTDRQCPWTNTSAIAATPSAVGSRPRAAA